MWGTYWHMRHRTGRHHVLQSKYGAYEPTADGLDIEKYHTKVESIMIGNRGTYSHKNALRPCRDLFTIGSRSRPMLLMFTRTRGGISTVGAQQSTLLHTNLTSLRTPCELRENLGNLYQFSCTDGRIFQSLSVLMFTPIASFGAFLVT